MLISGDVVVEKGAKLNVTSGQVLLAGSNVTNAGTISRLLTDKSFSPRATVCISSPRRRTRTCVACWSKVGKGGTVTNTADGVISADRGNATLVGLMVNQTGRVSATTSVRQNGSIRLLARDGGLPSPSGDTLTASNGGTLTLGKGSVTGSVVGADERRKNGRCHASRSRRASRSRVATSRSPAAVV